MKKQFILILKSIVLLISLVGSICAETVGDYDGDGKTDLLIRRRNTQNSQLFWYSLNSKDNSFNATQWGHNPYPTTPPQEDVPVIGDFDGDGKTDIGVFRKYYASPPEPTYFYILQSSDNTLFALQWGTGDDIELSQDYDGDGKCDPTVVRNYPLLGRVWFVYGSQRGYFTVTNRAGGFPIRGDYDGDGKADYATVTTGMDRRQVFHILKSSANQLEDIQFGNGNTDYAVPGDYDGDGKTDVAVWRGKNEAVSGLWYWIRSSDGNLGAVRFGTGTQLFDFPTPGDYDGDGKTDPAVYRQGSDLAAQAYFYILASNNGFYGVPWGSGSDDAPLFYQAR